MTDQTDPPISTEPILPRGVMACPECQVLVRREEAEHHASTHWPPTIHPYPEHMVAIERQKALRDFGSKGQR